jgi:hypothetical protein
MTMTKDDATIAKQQQPTFFQASNRAAEPLTGRLCTPRTQDQRTVNMSDELVPMWWQGRPDDCVGHAQEFEEVIQVEQWVCDEFVNKGPRRREAVDVILARANDIVFSSGVDWRCVTCQGKATASVNNPALDVGHSLPAVIDRCCFPVCGLSSCKSAASRKSVLASSDMQKCICRGNLVFCSHCAVSESQGSLKLSLCLRCEKVRCCSKKCQKADWKVHETQERVKSDKQLVACE